jgi:hypothetical protein
MSLEGFEPAISSSERLQTQALDRAAIGTVHTITETTIKQGRVYRVKRFKV